MKTKKTFNKIKGVRNNLEEKYWKQVLSILKKKNYRKRNKYRLEYETEKLPYVLPSPIRNYHPDFIIRRPNGKTLYLEIKGFYRPEDRVKMLAVKRANPEADIRMVFPRDNKLNAKSKTTYSDWCKKYGFKYCIGEIPEEWFK